MLNSIQLFHIAKARRLGNSNMIEKSNYVLNAEEERLVAYAIDLLNEEYGNPED